MADDSRVITVPTLGEQIRESSVSTNVSNDNKSGTERSPLFVKVMSAEKSPQDAQEHDEDRINASKVANANVAFAWIGAFQLLIVTIQCCLLWAAFKSGEKQGATIESIVTQSKQAAVSIAEGAANIRLAADAMRSNAEMAKDKLEKQMRAYLHVDSGTALFQETENEFLFQARPLLTNNGFTSARNIRIRVRAEIMRYPTPLDTVFREPLGTDDTWYLGPRQSMSLPVSVESLVPEEEIANIKAGKKKILYAWGIVTYDDINDGHQTLNFFLNYQWLNNGGIVGTFIGGRCNST